MVAWDALDALSHQFELCKIGATTRVVVVVDDTTTNEQRTLISTALQRSGSDALEIRVVERSHASDEQTLLSAATQPANVVITTGQPRPELRSATNQVLHLADVPPHLFAPHANLKRRTRTLHQATHTASMLTLNDAHGTALQIQLAESVVAGDHGIVDSKHRAACFPAGWVSITPAANTVSGQLVLMPGDANLGADRLISSPVRLQLLDDHVTEIEGDSADADVIRAVFEYANDSHAYGVAEMTVGLNPGAAPAGVFDTRLLDPVISRLLAGTVTLSFGTNLIADRPANQTITLALPGRSLAIDGLPVTTDGQLQGDFAPDVYEL